MPKLVTVIAVAALTIAAQGAVAQSSSSQREQRQEQRQDRREERQERREQRQDGHDGTQIAAPEIDTSNGTKALALLIAAVLLAGEALRRRHVRRRQ